MRGSACESLKSLWILLGVPERTASLEAWCRTGWNKNIMFHHYALRLPCTRIHGTFSWQFPAITELMPCSCWGKTTGDSCWILDADHPLKLRCDKSNSCIWTCHVISQTHNFISVMELCLPLADTCWKFHLCKIQKCSFLCDVSNFCVIQTLTNKLSDCWYLLQITGWLNRKCSQLLSLRDYWPVWQNLSLDGF